MNRKIKSKSRFKIFESVSLLAYGLWSRKLAISDVSYRQYWIYRKNIGNIGNSGTDYRVYIVSNTSKSDTIFTIHISIGRHLKPWSKWFIPTTSRKEILQSAEVISLQQCNTNCNPTKVQKQKHFGFKVSKFQAVCLFNGYHPLDTTS